LTYFVFIKTVTVSTVGGAEYTADHVIFTGSLGVLKATHRQLFTPELPTKKQEAIENIGFGSVTKLAFEFETPFWPAEY
jgi:spermine oxidase